MYPVSSFFQSLLAAASKCNCPFFSLHFYSYYSCLACEVYALSQTAFANGD